MGFRSTRSALVIAVVLIVASSCSGPEAASSPAGSRRVLVDPSEASTVDADSSQATTGDADNNADPEAPGALAFDRSQAGEDGDPNDPSTGEDSTNDSTSGNDDFSANGNAGALDGTSGASSGSTLESLTTELISFVEQERGLTFAERPVVELLDNSSFGEAWTQVIADDAIENSTDYEDFTDIYRALGIVDGQRTLEEIWAGFGDGGVVGFYDSSTGTIKLRSGEITSYTETVLVHELVHALEDQVFGLDRSEDADRSNEIAWTFSALTEGSARVIEDRYRAQLSSAELAEETAVLAALPRTVSLSDFSTSFLELQFGRSRYGELFAEALWSEGQRAIDNAFENPPETSELVLDPGAYLRGTPSDPTVSLPSADGDVFASGVWGEAAWAAVLNDVFDRDDALDFADGWGGDSYVAWRTATGTCVRLHVGADSPADLDGFAAAIEEWASGQQGREIFYPTADIVRVTACG